MPENDLASRLIQFVGRLDPERFDVGPHQMMSVHQLLLRLAVNGLWPQEWNQLGMLVGPLVCRTPEEQVEFAERFARWAREQPDWRASAPADAKKSGSPTADHKWVWRMAAVLALAAIAIGAAYAGWVFSKTPDPPRALPAPAVPTVQPMEHLFTGVVTDERFRPIPNVSLWYEGKKTETGEKGDFRIRARRVPVKVLHTHNEYEPVLLERPGMVNVTMKRKPQLPDAPPPPPPPPVKATQTPVVPTTEETPPWFSSLRWALTALPLLVLAGLLAYMLLRRHQLKKWSAPLELTQKRIEVRGTSWRPFDGARMRVLARELRRRRPQPSADLNLGATIHATCKQAGLLTPVFAERMVAPEFLILLERRHVLDQQTRYYEELIAALAANEVIVDCYYYSGDPRVCRGRGKGDPDVSLDELVALHPHHDLWIIGDPRTLLDPWTREASGWLPRLSHWSNRMVAIPGAVESWMSGPLRAAGCSVAVASVEGILQELTRGVPPEAKSIPGLLLDEPEKWLGHEEADASDVVEMMLGVRGFLGTRGMELLCACAVYPSLTWNLTLHLAHSILAEPEREEVLGRLVQLPWLRHASMPDWVRRRLVSRLPEPELRDVLAALGRYLERSEQGTRPSGAIDVAKPKLKGKKAPLQDFVFLSLLWGRKLDPLAVESPGWLRRLLFDQGYVMFGLRKVTIALMAVVLPAMLLGGSFALEPFVKGRNIAPPPSLPPPGVFEPPRRTLSPFLARMLDVGASQFGQRSDGGYSFIDRCLRVTSEVMALPMPEIGRWEQRMRQRPAADVRPGMLFITVDTGTHAGMVESVGPGYFTGLEAIAGIAKRVPRLVANIKGGFVDLESETSRVNPIDGLRYRYIPPGKFQMGCSPPGDLRCVDNEERTRTVTITKGFWLGETEVTQAAYQRVTGKRPSKFKGTSLPVEQVDWTEARDYCVAIGVRLPTEAEWEYAARAGSTTETYDALDEIAWYAANSKGTTHPVAGKRPNRWGLYDMLGNVFEWTADWYEPNYYRTGEKVDDPKGPSSGTLRILRGGCWDSIPLVVRVSNRNGSVPEFRDSVMGFRCAGE